jgi:hypothetical protein
MELETVRIGGLLSVALAKVRLALIKFSRSHRRVPSAPELEHFTENIFANHQFQGRTSWVLSNMWKSEKIGRGQSACFGLTLADSTKRSSRTSCDFSFECDAGRQVAYALPQHVLEAHVALEVSCYTLNDQATD